MDNIKDIINKVVGDIAEKTPDAYSRIERIWKNILTETELKHTKLSGIKDETLLVHVDSPAWLHQMRIKQTRILKRLKEESPNIKSIRFKIGSIKS